MHFPIFYSTIFILFTIQLSGYYGEEEISYNYIFDYISITEVKTGDKEYLPILKYSGNVETSPYILQDDQELILVKLKVNEVDEVKVGKSVVGIVIRKKGLVERMVVDSTVDVPLVNLFKGVINLININEMRENKTEADMNGECFVRYESINEELLIKEKFDCNKTVFHSSFPEIVDSFSFYQDSKIVTHYRFNKDGSLIAVDNFETHLSESVLSEELSTTFRSNTSLLLNKFVRSKSLISSATVDSVIANVFGSSYRDVFLMSAYDLNYNEPISDKKFLARFKHIIKDYDVTKRAQTTLELMGLLRQVISRPLLMTVMKQSNEVAQIVRDALIGCSTKLCAEVVVEELDGSFLNDVPEANRLLLMIQHITRPSEFIVRALWTRLTKMPENVYDQAIQTIASLVERIQHVEHLSVELQAIVDYLANKLTSCDDDHCVQVHLTAARNTRLPQFRHSLALLLANNGRYSQSVMASVFSGICSLNYDDQNKIEVQQLLLGIVRREINFYGDPLLKSEAILCLIRLEIDTSVIVSVLDSLTDDKHGHLQVFLARKLRELITMGIIRDGDKVMESAFFRRQRHLSLTYKDESKMLVNQLMSTRSLYSDIHFNVIGDDGGVIRNSMTDVFLVTTAHENHLFSLATHLTGIQSLAGSTNTDELIEGQLRLVLLGKEARPIKLFSGTTELMSALWYAPSTLQSVLSATFFPIDLQKDISFQNGIVLSTRYVGASHVDFSFRLTSNLWYKTADSLLTVTGLAHVVMDTRLNALNGYRNRTQSFSLKSGLDFETNVDFSATPMKNCFVVSRPLSHITVTTLSKKSSKHVNYSTSSTQLQGSCYSLSRLTDQLCSSFL